MIKYVLPIITGKALFLVHKMKKWQIYHKKSGALN
ncbi:MAG: hypothetical protein ACI815_002084 [Psychroserpens sp.]|jgi:hypothetical protein